MDWNALEPWDKVALFILNAGTIGGLIAEHRRAARAEKRAEEAHRLLSEAHTWNREEAERSRKAAFDEHACREWCVAMRVEILRANSAVQVPEDVPPDWLMWGEMNRCFKVRTFGHSILLGRPE
jgi:hypothetical protein